MDAAVALQRKKTIKFLCIVDFPLSKQGIFFVTLRQKSRGKYIAATFSLFQHCKMQPRQLHFTVLPRQGFIPLRTCNLRWKRV